MKKTIFLSLFLFGCASVTPSSFKGPSGKNAFSMQCSGMGRTIEECYKKAGELCPKGYNIINNDKGNSMILPAGNTFFVTTQERLVIECKN